MTREVVIWCLVYLWESTDQLLKEYEDADGDSVSQDLAVQKMKIYRIKTNIRGDCCNVMGDLQYLEEMNVPSNLRLMLKLPYKMREMEGGCIFAGHTITPPLLLSPRPGLQEEGMLRLLLSMLSDHQIPLYLDISVRVHLYRGESKVWQSHQHLCLP
ncbi:hypothetical protein SRHO_G00289940 [Serrasalmus rhombeus]